MMPLTEMAGNLQKLVCGAQVVVGREQLNKLQFTKHHIHHAGTMDGHEMCERGEQGDLLSYSELLGQNLAVAVVQQTIDHLLMIDQPSEAAAGATEKNPPERLLNTSEPICHSSQGAATHPVKPPTGERCRPKRGCSSQKRP